MLPEKSCLQVHTHGAKEVERCGVPSSTIHEPVFFVGAKNNPPVMMAPSVNDADSSSKANVVI